MDRWINQDKKQLLLAFLLVSVGIWRLTHVLDKSRDQEALKALDLQANMAQEFVSHEIQRIKQQLLDGATKSDASLNTPILAVGIFEPQTGEGWKLISSWQRPMEKRGWPQNFLATQMSDLRLRPLKANEVSWTRLEDPLQRPLFAFSAPVQHNGNAALVVGLYDTVPLSLWSQGFRQASTEFIVVNDLGYALSLNNMAYAGARLDRHKTVQKMMAAPWKGFLDITENLSGQKSYGAARAIPDTNLSVIITEPRRLGMMWILETILWTFGIALLAITFGYLILKRKERELNQRQDEVVDVTAEQSSPKSKEKIVEATEELMAPHPIEIRSLLNGILEGPVQKALTKVHQLQAQGADEVMSRQLVSLEGEMRKVQEQLQKTLSYDRETPEVKLGVPVVEAVNKTLNRMKDWFDSAGVSVNQEGGTEAKVKLSEDAMQTVLEEIFKNAIEAMHGALHKEISVRWYKEDGQCIIDIQDTGAGIGDEVRGKVFDPFFTTKSGGTGSGIGLTVVRNVVQGARGRVLLLTPTGQGTLVRLILPELQEQKSLGTPANHMAGSMDFIDQVPEQSELVRKPKVKIHEGV